MLEKDENASVFGQELIEQYANFVITELKEFQRSKYYQQLSSKEQKYLIEWMQSFAPPYNPKIIISCPYQSNLLGLTEFVPEDERREIIHNLKEIVRQKIEITPIIMPGVYQQLNQYPEYLQELKCLIYDLKMLLSGKLDFSSECE